MAAQLLGDCYHNGDGRPRDDARSARLNEAAGQRGMIDPLPANRTESQKMVDLIAGIAPDVKAEVITMIATRRTPSE